MTHRKIRAEGTNKTNLAAGLVAILVVLGSLASRSAVADDRQRVQVVLAADPSVGEKLFSVLRRTLARQSLDVAAVVVPRLEPIELVRAPIEKPPAGPVVRAWIDLVASQPMLYLVGPSSELVYVRPLPVHANPDAVEIELIRFVVDEAVKAILNGDARGISRDEFGQSLEKTPPPPGAKPEPVAAPPQRTTTVETPPPPLARRFLIWGGYAAGMLSSDVVQQGPQLGGDLRFSRWGIGVTALQALPVLVTRSDLGTRLTSSGLRIVADVPVKLRSGFVASLGLGGGIDATHVAPEGMGATSAFWTSDPLACATAALERGFGSLIASLDFGVDWYFLAARYAVLRSDGASTLFAPWRWRPFAALRLGFAF